MSYSVTYGDAQTYTSAWFNCRGNGALYISDSARLTPAIKRAIISDIEDNPGRIERLDTSEINSYWDTLSISKWNDVTIRPLHVANETDTEDWRVSVDYTYDRGSGDLETERVKFLRV